MIFVYAGAAASHFAVGDPVGKVLTPIGFVAITLLSWVLRPSSRRDPLPSA